MTPNERCFGPAMCLACMLLVQTASGETRNERICKFCLDQEIKADAKCLEDTSAKNNVLNNMDDNCKYFAKCGVENKTYAIKKSNRATISQATKQEARLKKPL